MFAYSDPTGTGVLAAAGALQNYRDKVGFFDQRFHSITQSGYTLREAFDELAPGTQAQTATVRWSAFPVTAPASASAGAGMWIARWDRRSRQPSG